MAGWVDELDTVDNKVVIFKISMLLVNIAILQYHVNLGTLFVTCHNC